MPSLGKGMIRATLEAANADRPRARMVVPELPKGMTADMEVPGLANDAPAGPMGPDLPLAPVNKQVLLELATSKQIPWKSELNLHERLLATMELEQLMAHSKDDVRLDQFSRQYFGNRWKSVAPHIEELFGYTDNGFID